MENYNTTPDTVVLGDGELYLAYYKDVINTDGSLKAETDIVAALKMVGAIDSGATITYKPTNQTVKAVNRAKFYYKTDEETTFKSGTLNFIPDNIGFVAPVIQTVDSTTGIKKLVVGGKKQSPNIYLRYIHEEPDGSKIQVDMTNCQCTNGTDFAFNDKPVVLDMEFESLTGMTDAGCMTIQFIPATVPIVPTQLVTNLNFTDTNKTAGNIAGTLTWSKCADESNVTGYRIYLLDSYSNKVGNAITTVNKGTESYSIPSTAIITGTTQLAVYSVNDIGESVNCAKITFTDVTA